MKPIWHNGEWTDEDTADLIDELNEAKQYRSLTNEEQVWLKAVLTNSESY
jgi:hypothetical protein